MKNTAVIIPSRLDAKRLPKKPLTLINGIPMIVHVLNRAKAANVGQVFVATPDLEIAEIVKKGGGDAILTEKKHMTGSDRVFEAFNKLQNKTIEFVINLQGDMPNINPDHIKRIDEFMKMKNCDLGTLASNVSESEIENINVVKLETKEQLSEGKFLPVKNFSRKIEKKTGSFFYYHIGIYGFTRNSLSRFINLKQSKNEIERNLEQMRAIDNGFLIRTGFVDNTPIGVDTEADFLQVTKQMKK
tara:strand:- start:176 stop:907 length:732 start_codon:yes stop_codon:yes gene_type:complete